MPSVNFLLIFSKDDDEDGDDPEKKKLQDRLQGMSYDCSQDFFF